MSYCRFSSDDYRCDLYCYESAQGFVTHVAGLRSVLTKPLPPPVNSLDDPDAWFKRHDAVMKIVDRSKRVPIGLAHDGETFVDATEEAMFERIRYLAGVGYNVPAELLDEYEATQ